MTRLFVTGTDTDVGKTVVSACLARHAASLGTVWALKPVASGVAAGTPADDAVRLGRAAGHPPASCYTLQAPLAPSVAAALEGRVITLDALRSWVAKHTADRVLLEGVGGWRVPLGPGLELRDLALDLGWPVLVVAADRLGALNHTLLTVAAVQAAGLRVAGVVLNRGVEPERVVPSNLASLRELLRVPVLPIGHDPDAAEVASVWRGLWMPQR